ncbi:hypothetical protein bcere0024_048480 [Bacillus cereus Rock4-18]|nr:hypothetical protein bcere0024_048480 [Bacillus cereus Rock4-18]
MRSLPPFILTFTYFISSMRISRKSDITAKDRKDAGRKALKSAVVKGWINVGK